MEIAHVVYPLGGGGVKNPVLEQNQLGGQCGERPTPRRSEWKNDRTLPTPPPHVEHRERRAKGGLGFSQQRTRA